MADKLTSVRFDTQTLGALTAIADVQHSSVAGVVRVAVAEYVQRITSAPDFEQAASLAFENRKNRVKELVARVRRDPGPELTGTQSPDGPEQLRTEQLRTEVDPITGTSIPINADGSTDWPTFARELMADESESDHE